MMGDIHFAPYRSVITCCLWSSKSTVTFRRATDSGGDYSHLFSGGALVPVSPTPPVSWMGFFTILLHIQAN